MATLLYRLGRSAYRHRRAVLAAWLAVLAAVIACLVAFGGQTDDEFTIPGSESQRAMDTLKETLPAAAGTSAQIVFIAPKGHEITEPRYTSVISATMAQADKAPQVVGVTDPIETKTISPDRTTALGQVQYEVSRAGLKDGSLDAVEDATQDAKHAGLTVEVGGNAYSTETEASHTRELLGLVAALVVLTITFGSLLTAGMPLLTAVLGVGVMLLGLHALTGTFTISSTALSLATMLGLAVGIDYALFILSRHRSQLAQGMPPRESAATATGTAGSAVVFAGLTVVIALVGLSVVGIPFLTVMGLAGAGAVLVAVAVALTLLPALLGFAGERLRPKPGSRAARREQAAHTSGRLPFGERWGRIVTRRPLVTLAATLIALLTLALPVRDLHLSMPVNATAPTDSTQRKTYDSVADAFGPGFNGPLLIVASPSDAADLQQTTAALVEDLKKTQGVAAVGQPMLTETGDAVIQLVPKTGPTDEKTTDLVQHIRDEASQWQKETGADVKVTGKTAVSIDVSSRLADSLPLFALVVVGLSLLLLMLVFRSLVVPLKASLGFLLSVAAALGAVVAVFQWGWLADALGVSATGPVASILPTLVMAVLFGLAMDYEVFLVSRMREAYVHGADPQEAILTGCRQASRVVTAAALIMFAVFTGFVPGAGSMLKSIAFALAFGVLVDAFIVRMTLVPAVLALVGKAAWWLPKWLDRLLPNLDTEGERLAKPSPAASTDDSTLSEVGAAVAAAGTPEGRP
ncbi:MMPL family transporter [Streptomyces ipomoeae]|uniref:MMPL family transporter n=1 Tax=Streptomyces ipomoeae TaxID=103232 RepID=UPI00114761B9|nr:MMPL family transporter [Streptomyces ipomoeae]MDX2935536.1 MMPL family transporter [Streptomyces ipomoeae]TQE18364.1 MMPL family transporter [Streptomyces ipomoeae]